MSLAVLCLLADLAVDVHMCVFVCWNRRHSSVLLLRKLLTLVLKGLGCLLVGVSGCVLAGCNTHVYCLHLIRWLCVCNLFSSSSWHFLRSQFTDDSHSCTIQQHTELQCAFCGIATSRHNGLHAISSSNKHCNHYKRHTSKHVNPQCLPDRQPNQGEDQQLAQQTFVGGRLRQTA